MNNTQKALDGIVDYEKLSSQNALEPPKIKKDEIPTFFLCNNFLKAQNKIEQKMERYNSKVKSIDGEIQYQKKIIKKANYETNYVDTTSAQSVARHNDWVDRGRKAAEKHDDLIGKHNDALEDAKEKLQELTEDSLAAIDEDIVTVLDKCNKSATKLSNSQNSGDWMSALEICFIELKIFNFFEDFIDGNASRRDARDRIGEVNQLFTELSQNEDLRNHISDIFRRNVYLVEKNDSQYGQITQMIEAMDQSEMDQNIQDLQEIFNKKFDTSFDYEHVIDPSELHNLSLKVNEQINDIKNNISKATQADESANSLAENAVKTQDDIEKLLESAKQEVEELGSDLISHDHFAIEILNESVIDDFYSRDLRPKVDDFRKYLADEIEEEKLDRFIMTEEDRFSLQKIENTIKEANLKRLQLERDKIEAHKEKMNNLIESLQKIIKSIEGIPKKKSDELKSDYSKKSILSFIPFIGFIFSFGIFRKIKSFEAAFKSTNQIYRDTGTSLFAKNKKIIIINLIVGFVLTVGSLITLLVMETGFPFSVKLGLPGAILFLYLISTLFLLLTGKKLDSYIGLTSDLEQKETATENA